MIRCTKMQWALGFILLGALGPEVLREIISSGALGHQAPQRLIPLDALRHEGPWRLILLGSLGHGGPRSLCHQLLYGVRALRAYTIWCPKARGALRANTIWCPYTRGALRTYAIRCPKARWVPWAYTIRCPKMQGPHRGLCCQVPYGARGPQGYVCMQWYMVLNTQLNQRIPIYKPTQYQGSSLVGTKGGP